ncbi:hypothetical protein A1O1_03668 [Capronia coronata CBS 617.96]|uniref:RRM domain-containing protein n=1 Tax=Capronia coronata CBS 617.96 TaxID=1182541 RepID=W9YLL1_9EURO|nr:uncharacterized protein A1O1_03668 [Capronia coronata CBS 617.96]EXJ90565.1 hypothetical protein A1O1_03668 [Capronia coronata CBS 617.96]
MGRFEASCTAAKEPPQEPPVKRSRLWDWLQKSTEAVGDGREVLSPAAENAATVEGPVAADTDFMDNEETGEALEDGFGEEEAPATGAEESRSLKLGGLAPSTTLLDITRVVRGGIILQMFVRPWNGTAHVSFVEPVAAKKFFEHAKMTGLSIKNRSATVEWELQQAYLNNDLAFRIDKFGATRNLVIRSVRPEMTAEAIKLDLEHIFNLWIVDITFKDGDAYLSLNRTILALTARNCMRSRRRYRKMTI